MKKAFEVPSGSCKVFPGFRIHCIHVFLTKLTKGYLRATSPSYLLKSSCRPSEVRILSFEDMPDQDLSRYSLISSHLCGKMFCPGGKAKNRFIWKELHQRKKQGKLVAIPTQEENHIGGRGERWNFLKFDADKCILCGICVEMSFQTLP